MFSNFVLNLNFNISLKAYVYKIAVTYYIGKLNSTSDIIN